MKKLSDLFKKNKRSKKKIEISNNIETNTIDEETKIKKDLDENINIIKNELGNSSDIVIKRFFVGKNQNLKLAIAFTDGLVKKEIIYDFILKSLMVELKNVDIKEEIISKNDLVDKLEKSIIPDADMKKIDNYKNLFIHLLTGDTIILVDEYDICLTASTRDFRDRGVMEPSTQSVIRGPKDGFCETLRTNTSLIRRRIKNINLRVEQKIIGSQTNTDIAIVYIKGIANDKIVKEVKDRIDRIDIDSVLESGYIEELIQDEPYSPFPTVYNSERPDTVAAGLLEGRVAILVDGTPFVLLVPALFIQFFQSAEDYYQRADISSLIRIMRYIALFLALLTPSLFIAVTTFHQEMLPPALLISIAAQREGIPFPALIEALIMEFTFEILREAGVRMPKAIGSAISIVGALVLGDAAVQAGFVSPAMVIVVSITAISSFISPAYNMGMTIRMLRFVFMLLGASFGLFGVALGLLTMLLHLCSLRSFGVPYMSPMAPFNAQGQKDSLIRLPLWTMFKRPRYIADKNTIRQQKPKNAKPQKPE